MIRITSEQFEELKRLQEPEVFTEAQMGAWVEGLKDTLVKAEVDELDEVEKAVVNDFNHEFTSFVKVQVISTPSESELSKGLKYENFFMREKQVEWIEIEKGNKVAIGTVHNGFKKVAEGKWQKVSESHGLTREEHNKLKLAYEKPLKQAEAGKEKMPQRDWLNQLNFNEKQAWENYNTHFDAETRLDNKEYSDEEVHGTNKAIENDIEKSEDPQRTGIYLDTKLNREMNRVGLVFGEKVEKSEEDELEKGGEGSKGGKIIGHTKSGKPVYQGKDAHEYSDFSKEDHEEAANLHEKQRDYHKMHSTAESSHYARKQQHIDASQNMMKNSKEAKFQRVKLSGNQDYGHLNRD